MYRQLDFAFSFRENQIKNTEFTNGTPYEWSRIIFMQNSNTWNMNHQSFDTFH